MSRPRAVLDGLERIGRFVEDAFLVVILTAMIVLAAAQILLRNAFDISFFWTDELLRLMVLWIAVGGAVAASRADKHINIAVLDQYFSGRLLSAVRTMTHAFTAAICGLVALFGAQFVLTSREFGDVLLGGVPAWWLQAVLPVGFALMAWRYAVFTVSSLWRAIRGGDDP